MAIWGGKPQSSTGTACALNPTEPTVTYQIPYSLRFRGGANTFLTRTPTVAGNQSVWTWAYWFKLSDLSRFLSIEAGDRGASGHPSNVRAALMIDGGSRQLQILIQNSTAGIVTPKALFRDPSAWQQLVVSYNANDPVARVRIYINGVNVTDFQTNNQPPVGQLSQFNWTSEHRIGQTYDNFTFDGYLADITFIDGQALDATAFGAFDATTGVWMPKAYAGAYGTNGFRLRFDDAANLGKDSSGNNNHWTANNFSVNNAAAPFSDQMVDTPTNYGTDTGKGGEVRGNYCTWNAISHVFQKRPSDGNLTGQGENGNFNLWAIANIHFNSGKYYAEVSRNNVRYPNFYHVGIIRASTTDLDMLRAGASNCIAYIATGEKKILSTSASAYGSAYNENDAVGIAVDYAAQSVTFYLNGVSQGAINSPALFNGEMLTFFVSGDDQQSPLCYANFGQRPFKHAAPSGFKALCSTNLPKAQIAPKNHFDIVLDTGANIKAAADAKNMPGLMWIKDRQNANNHQLIDVLRGANALHSNDTNPESAYAPPSGNSVAWLWRGGDNAVGTANTDGSIPSTVRACKGAGFSIVTHIGTAGTDTVGHGLGAVPSFIIHFVYNTAGLSRAVRHIGMGNMTSAQMDLAGTGAQVNLGTATSAPTSSVFGVSSSIARATHNCVSYVFAEVPSFSKFGSYQGTGNSDGPFCYTGFAPKFVMVKKSSADAQPSGWLIYDTFRNAHNISDLNLRPNTNDAESSQVPNNIDILSNGFKIRGDSTGSVNNAQTYIYAAFAEHPLTYGRAR